jgi:hypothetical protein
MDVYNYALERLQTERDAVPSHSRASTEPNEDVSYKAARQLSRKMREASAIGGRSKERKVSCGTSTRFLLSTNCYVTRLVAKYMANPRSNIILAVVSAKNDFLNQIVRLYGKWRH